MNFIQYEKVKIMLKCKTDSLSFTKIHFSHLTLSFVNLVP